MDQKAIADKIKAKIKEKAAYELTERVTLADLGAFVSQVGQALLPKEIQLDHLFPASHFAFLRTEAIGLDYLKFQAEAPGTKRPHLELILSWTSPLELFDGTFRIEGCAVALLVENGSWTATLGGQLVLADYPLDILVELPSLFTKVSRSYQEDESTPGSPLKMLEEFGASLDTGSPKQGSQLPTLKQLMLLASPMTRTFQLRLALSHIPVGPGTIDLDAFLSYRNGHITGSFWGDFILKKDEKPLLAIVLRAAHDGPGKGLQLEGGLATKDLNFVHLFQALKEKFGGGAELPEALQQDSSDPAVHVKSVYLSFNTATKAFRFSISLDFHSLFGQDKGPEEIDLKVQIAVNPFQEEGQEKTQYHFNFSGQVIFRLKGGPDLAFELVFDKKGGSNTLVAAYRQLSDQSVNIGRLIQALNKDLPDLDLSVALREAYLVFQKKGKGKSSVILGANIGAGINLSKLPLVGDLLPEADSLKLDLQPYYANQKFTSEEIGALNDLMPGDKLSLPARIDQPGPGMSITLQLGKEPLHLDFPIKLGEAKTLAAEKEGAKDGQAPSASSADQSQDGTKWFKISKSFGPIQFERLGVKYEKEVRRFHFKIDGALSAAGLTLTLEGLAASIVLPKDTKEKFDLQPKFDLKGLGLDFKKGKLEIGASFLRSEGIDEFGDPYDDYSGLALIRYNTFSLAAIGSIAFIRGQMSLFLYGVLNYPIGGPSFFFVTGLAAGFGVNRELRMPEIEQVRDFPMIKLALDASEGKEVKPHGDRRDFITGIISSLHEYVPPRLGAYFLAVGIRFTSFKLLDSFILLSVSFGKHFSIDALGISTLVAPAPVPGQKPVPPLVFVEMALAASFRPEEGFLGVRAQLTEKSFLFSKDCHLRGGFAFYTWFDPSEHAGDFVLTLGGYHPSFKAPDHYPQVPRLGYSWQVTSELVIKGEFYFALTASALMAGGHYNATYESGDVKAWFDASANFIVSWQPYFYAVDFHLDMGVDVTIHFFGTHHLFFDLGADLEVWGPDFSGHATIHLSVISFTVSFGSALPMPMPVSWKEFQDAFLPAKDKVVNAKVSKGLLKELTDEGQPLYLVNPQEMEIEVESVVPLHSLKKEKEQLFEDAQKFGMGPMGTGVGAPGLSSSLSLLKANFESDDFAFVPIKKRMPSAIWGGKIKPGVNDARFQEDLTVGFRMYPKEATDRGAEHEVDQKDLAFEEYPVDRAFYFEPERTFAARSFEHKDDQRDSLQKSLLDRKSVETRNRLIEALGFEVVDFAGGLDENLAGVFVEAPQIGTIS